MKKIKFSVIIPIYNVENYLKRALDSVLNQEGDVEYEIICVNDCSTDNSLDILNGYSQEKNIKIIDLEKNVGLGEARNIGARIAKGDYLCMLDSDDWFDSKYFVKLSEIIDKNDDVEEIMISYMKITNKGNIPIKLNIEGFVDPKYSCKIVSAWSKIVRRDKYIEFLPKIKYEDFELIIRKITSKSLNNIYFLDEPLYNYDQTREGNIMNKIHSDDMIYILNTFEMSEMDEFQKTLILELFFDRFCLYGILRHDYTIFKKLVVL